MDNVATSGAPPSAVEIETTTLLPSMTYGREWVLDAHVRASVSRPSATPFLTLQTGSRPGSLPLSSVDRRLAADIPHRGY